MVKITAKSEPEEEIIIDKALIGSTVYAKNGERIGTVKDLYINPKNFKIKWITIDKGIFKFDHMIESNYIESIGSKGIILNIIPLEDLVDKTVIDRRGEEIGKIKEINKDEPTNNLISMTVSRGIGKKDFSIKPKDIKSIGKSIILLNAREEFV